MAAFPDDFVWGVATASYQIEGAVDEDGRGESIWDRFSRTPGKVEFGHTGDVACDHYHRWEQDLDLIASLGVDAYRFSIAWPRVVPDGIGAVNSAGLDFYDKLVDGLLERGIMPFPTLYHWDLPQAIEAEGGWLKRSTADAFAHYTAAVVERLGDRVRHWFTLNEPWCSSVLGYGVGLHAPGLTGDHNAVVAAHHLLLAHGTAVPIVQASGAEVGIVLNMDHKVSSSTEPLDVEAADMADQKMGRWFLDPLSGRGYPEAAVLSYRWEMAEVHEGDLGVISTPVDHIGLNYYTTEHVRSSELDDDDRAGLIADPHEFTDMGWPVAPHGIIPLLHRLADYGYSAIYITENGAAYPDIADEVGYVDDQDRISYLSRHFEAVSEAVEAGVGVKGYFVWSLMDNFEWASGYDKRFGIVRVDYETLERTPKASALWFRDSIS